MTARELELKISKLLRVGVLVAGAFIFVGWIGDLLREGDQLSSFKDYDPVDLVASVGIAWAARNYAVIAAYFGLALLVMLPAVRVLLTGILFFSQRERTLGWFALIVFAILVASFSLGTSL